MAMAYSARRKRPDMNAGQPLGRPTHGAAPPRRPGATPQVAPLGAHGGPSRPGRGTPSPTNKPTLGGEPPAPPRPGAAPKPPDGQHAAPDSNYYNRVDLIDKNEGDRLNELGARESGVRNDFGIDDPSNPFSRANGLKRAFLARQKGLSASLASQGQLYAGAHERAMQRTRFEEAQSRDELRRAYEAAIGQIGAEKAGVKFDSEQDRITAFEDWLARAPDAEVPADQDAPAADGPADPPPAPGQPLQDKRHEVGPNAGSRDTIIKTIPSASSGQRTQATPGGKHGPPRPPQPPQPPQPAKAHQGGLIVRPRPRPKVRPKGKK